MRTLNQMKQHLALHLNELQAKNREDRVIKAIFQGQDGTPCDCETCRYAEECEIGNPDFNANYCKFS